MYLWLIEKLLNRLNEKEKDRILTLSVRKLYNTISQEDILKEEGGVWKFQGRELNKATVKLLTVEANQLLGTKLWKVLKTDVLWNANRAMYLQSKSQMDLITGKLWTYVFDCMNTRLESLKGESGLFNKKG